MMNSIFRASSTSSRAARRTLSIYLAALLCLVAQGASQPAESASREGVILRKNFGIVEVKRAGTDKWFAANDRIIVYEGDGIRTAASSWSIIEVSRDNLLKMGPSSLVNIIKAVQTSERTGEQNTLFGFRQTGSIELDLKKGLLSPVLDRLQGREFRVRTPIVTIGVRGTSFTAQVEEAGEGESTDKPYNIDVEVYTGAVEITDMRDEAAAPYSLGAGQALRFRNVIVPRGGFRSGPGGAGAGPAAGGPGGQPGGAPGMAGGPSGQQGGGQQGQSGGSAPGGGGAVSSLGSAPTGATVGAVSMPMTSMPPAAAMGAAPAPNFQPPPPQ